MALFIYKVEFEILLEDDHNWMANTIYHLGDGDGGAAVTFVHDKLIGTQVDVTSALHPGESPSKKIIDWRLIGLTQLCKLNTIDADVLIENGIMEELENAHEQVATHPSVDQHNLVVASLGQSTDAGDGSESDPIGDPK